MPKILDWNNYKNKILLNQRNLWMKILYRQNPQQRVMSNVTFAWFAIHLLSVSVVRCLYPCVYNTLLCIKCLFWTEVVSKHFSFLFKNKISLETTLDEIVILSIMVCGCESFVNFVHVEPIWSDDVWSGRGGVQILVSSHKWLPPHPYLKSQHLYSSAKDVSSSMTSAGLGKLREFKKERDQISSKHKILTNMMVAPPFYNANCGINTNCYDSCNIW